MMIILHKSLIFGLDPCDDFLELPFNMVQGLHSYLPAGIQLIPPDRNPINEQIINVIDKRVLIIGLSDELEHVLIVLLREVEADDVEAVVEKGREDAGFGVAVLGGDEDVV